MTTTQLLPVVVKNPSDDKMIVMDDVETNIGNVLLRLGAITKEQLQCAVLHQRSMPLPQRLPLGEVLVIREDIDASMLSHALEVQAKERDGDIIGLVASLSKFVDGVAHRARSLGETLDAYEACAVPHWR